MHIRFKKSGEKYWIFSLGHQYSAPKRHFTLFLRTVLCTNTHVPPKGCPALPALPAFHPALASPPGQPPPCKPPPCPSRGRRPHPSCPPTCPFQPAPAHSATCYRVFPSGKDFFLEVPDFFLEVPDFFLDIPDFFLVQELTYCIDANFAATRRTMCPGLFFFSSLGSFLCNQYHRSK